MRTYGRVPSLTSVLKAFRFSAVTTDSLPLPACRAKKPSSWKHFTILSIVEFGNVRIAPNFF